MFQIRYGFVDNLTIEQVKLFADSRFNDKQMMQIREFIIENRNVSIDTLKFIVNLDF